MICVSASTLLNLNSITNVPMLLVDYISKPIRERIFSFALVVKYLIIFSMMKRVLVFVTEASFNSFLILKKVQRTKILVDRIEKMKKYFLSFLKSITYYKLLYHFLGFQFYVVRMKFCKLRIKHSVYCHHYGTIIIHR